MQTDHDMDEVKEQLVRNRVARLEKKLEQSQFRLCTIKDNKHKVSFYTGFPSFSL